MTRKEMYEAIKAYGLQSKLSRNMTQCTTVELEKVIIANTRKAASEMKTKTSTTVIETPKTAPVTKPATPKNEAKVIDDPFKAAIMAVLTVLDNAGVLDDLLEELDNE